MTDTESSPDPELSPTSRPVFIYDGACSFCKLWVERWRIWTGDRVEYLPSEEARVRFSDLAEEHLGAAAHHVAADGHVSRGAEAVFRTLAHAPGKRWPLRLYELLPPVAFLCELVYGLVARNRTWLHVAGRLLYGKDLRPSGFQVGRELLLRCLGVVYLIACGSLWVQIDGLAGSGGILPVANFVEGVHTEVARGGDSWLYLRQPSLFYHGASDGALHLVCGAGVALAFLLVIGVAPMPILILLWALYLSLVSSCGDFLRFQWDSLLLETGFLAIFVAPLRLLPRFKNTQPPSWIATWLLRWLLFRLLFASGVVKLASLDPTWWNLTALTIHYETQPLPTWIGWYIHQLPVWLHRVSTAVMFGIELALPFLLFVPRLPRRLAGVSFVALMVLICLTGNYGFFNLLTVTLCFLAFDDAFWPRFVRQRVVRQRFVGPVSRSFDWRWWIRKALLVPLAAVVLLVSSWLLVFASFRVQTGPESPAVVRWVHEGGRSLYLAISRFHLVNSYGLFADMTENRPEILIEGSLDGDAWRAYEFRWKPGDLKRKPEFVEPHMPRLDWQMWFAALRFERYLEVAPKQRRAYVGQVPWLANLLGRLFEGSPAVLDLLERDPFDGEGPPRFLRLTVEWYRFTDLETHSRDGTWWRRERREVIATYGR